MNIDYEKIGQRIRGWRIRKKMTQEQMATLIEREPAYISRIENGSLAWIECQPSGGKTPRNFALDRTGRYLLAENQDSDNITVFAIGADGRLTKGETYDFGSPVCIRFFQKTAF